MIAKDIYIQLKYNIATKVGIKSLFVKLQLINHQEDTMIKNGFFRMYMIPFDAPPPFLQNTEFVFTDRKYIIIIFFCIFLYITEWLIYNKYDQTILSLHEALLNYSYKGNHVQHYVIKFVSDLRHVGGFVRVLRLFPPIKLTDNIVKSGEKHKKHHKTNLTQRFLLKNTGFNWMWGL